MIDHWMCLPQCFLWSSDIIYPWFYFLWSAPLFFLPPMAMWILVSFINLELISVLFPLCIHSNHCSGSVGSIFLHFSYLALPSKFIAAAAKSLQSCPTLYDPIDGSPPGSPVPGIVQARTLEWVAISFSNAWKWKVKMKLLSRVRLLATPWTAAHQAPPPMGFSRQEYWSGVPLPSRKNYYFLNSGLNLFSHSPLGS